MQYFLSMQEGYREIIEKLQESHALWMEPYVDTCCRKQFAPKLEDEMTKGLQNLAEILEKKMLFCCIYVYQIAPYGKFPGKKLLIKNGALCKSLVGNGVNYSARMDCPEGLLPVTDNEEKILRDWYQNMKKRRFQDSGIWESVQIVARKLIFNNIYAEQYDEKGYLENWAEYHNWLQNTWNHRLVILEIGEGTRISIHYEKSF